MGGGPLIEETEEVYLYHAVISVMLPTKVSIGIRAQTKEEAEDVLRVKYSDQPYFEIVYLDVAEDDVARYLKEPKVI